MRDDLPNMRPVHLLDFNFSRYQPRKIILQDIENSLAIEKTDLPKFWPLMKSDFGCGYFFFYRPFSAHVFYIFFDSNSSTRSKIRSIHPQLHAHMLLSCSLYVPNRYVPKTWASVWVLVQGYFYGRSMRCHKVHRRSPTRRLRKTANRKGLRKIVQYSPNQLCVRFS